MQRMIALPLLTLVIAVVFAGCRDARGRIPSDGEFAAVMFELQVAAESAAMDTARFEAMRDTILDRHGMTAADLRAYVEATYGDAARLTEVWDSIGTRLTEESLK